MPEQLNPGSDEDRWLLDAELIMQATLDKEKISETPTNENQTIEAELVLKDIQ